MKKKKKINISEEMEKIKITKTFYNFIDMHDLINKKLGFNQRNAGKHFFPETGDFNDWCNSKNYPEKDPENKFRSSSSLWWAEFQQDIKNGIWKDTPYLDFWHFQIENCVNDDFRNDSYGFVDISLECVEEAEEWQKEIQKVWYETFKNYADEDGIIDIRISW